MYDAYMWMYDYIYIYGCMMWMYVEYMGVYVDALFVFGVYQDVQYVYGSICGSMTCIWGYM